MLALLAPGSVVVPQYSPGVPLDIYGGADVTGANTASAIDGQGALATLNAVGTSQISVGAATEVQTTTRASVRTVTENSWTTIATHSLTAAAGDVVQFTMQLDVNTLTSSGGTVNLPVMSARILKDGSPLIARTLALGPALYFASPVMFASDNPAAGAHTYVYQVYWKDYGDGTTKSGKTEDEYCETTHIKR
jgi:hypothetical protein